VKRWRWCCGDFSLSFLSISLFFDSRLISSHLISSHLYVVVLCSGNNLDAFYETIASVEVVTPPEYVGRLMDVLQKRRGQQQDIVREKLCRGDGGICRQCCRLMYCTHGYHWLLWLLWWWWLLCRWLWLLCRWLWWWWWWLLLWQVHLDADQVVLKYLVPWQEVVADMYDEVKSVSSGYASFDYNEAGSERADVVCVDMLINGEAIDALSFVCR